MTLNKEARRMVYQCALTLRADHPDWSTHTCLEEAFIKCAGRSCYNMPLELMLKEYRENRDATIKQLLDNLQSPKP